MPAAIEAVVFDIGGVLLDWNPRYLYRQLFDDEREMERFLSEICTLDGSGAGVIGWAAGAGGAAWIGPMVCSLN
jgi:2-haloacid dehalogenase